MPNIKEPQAFADYEYKKIILYFQEKGILQFKSPKCESSMKLESNVDYINNYFFRWRSKSPIHDIRENLRKNSIFWYIHIIHIPINVIYYLLFKCFLKNIVINKSYINITNFCNKLN